MVNITVIFSFLKLKLYRDTRACIDIYDCVYVENLYLSLCDKTYLIIFLSRITSKLQIASSNLYRFSIESV